MSGVDLHLTAAERYGGDAMHRHPVGVEAAIGNLQPRRAPDGPHRLQGGDHAGFIVSQAERLVVEMPVDLHPPGFALRIGDPFGSILESPEQASLVICSLRSRSWQSCRGHANDQPFAHHAADECRAFKSRFLARSRHAVRPRLPVAP